MHTPKIVTERLILRRFTVNDLDALFFIYADKEVNTYLPWFPVEDLEEAKVLLEEKYLKAYCKPQGYNYAICLKYDNIPYITATHDVNNARSGSVMKRLGMKYQYSYEEQWQPKDFLVTFRLYQLNLDGNDSRGYRKYWDSSTVHFVETDI